MFVVTVAGILVHLHVFGNDRIQCVSKVPQLLARVANSTIHYKSSVKPRFDAMQVLIFRRQSRGAFRYSNSEACYGPRGRRGRQNKASPPLDCA